jgi:GTP cyclohydrolase I
LLTNETSIDGEAVEKAVRDFLRAIGEDPERDGLRNTPNRIARACTEIFAGNSQSAREVLETRFAIEHHEMVLVRDIEMYSICEHHLLPFHGTAHVAYIPNGKQVTGLSKIARLVEVFSRRLQVQERLTSEIAESLMGELGAAGCIVVLECEHLCMSMRGVKKSSSRTVTSAVRGIMREPATRAEVMALIYSKS